MSKKKKFFVMFFVLALVVGGVFLAINIFNPKADMTAPYENFYTVINNEKLETIETNNDNLVLYMSGFSNASLSNTAKPYLTKYTAMQSLFDNYTKTNEFIQSNIMYLTDYDKKLVEIQRELTKLHEEVLEKYDDCTNHIKTHIVPLKRDNLTNTWQMMQAIQAYDGLFMEFVEMYSDFYSLTSELFNNYTTNTINANPYTRQNLISITKWSEKITDNIVKKEFTGLTESITNLKKFTSSVIVSNPNIYFDNFEYFNEIISKVKVLSDDFYTSLVNNTHNQYLASITDEQEKQSIEKVLTEYFTITVAQQPGEQGGVA